MNTSKLKSFLSLLGLVAASAVTAHGQIVWGGLNTISASSDISLDGTYVDAVGNVGGSGVTVDVNGTNVTFHSLTLTTPNNYTDGHDITFSNIVSNSGGDSYTGSASIPVDYSTAMASVAYTGNGQGGQTGTVTLSNLTAGNEYLVEVWQARTDDSSRDTTFGSVGGVNSPTTTGGNYIIGTFIADSSDSQAFTYTGQTGELNTVELRDLGVPVLATPEPSSVALSLAGLGGLALLAYRRWAAAPQA